MNRPALPALCALLIGALLAIAAGAWQGQRNAQQIAQAFDQRVAEATSALGERLQRYQFGLRGARGAAVAAGLDKLDNESFRRYGATRDLQTEFPGARAFGIVRRIAPGKLEAFAAQARALGQPDFTLRELEPHDGDHFVIQYVEPKLPNRAAVGLDIASEQNRRVAAIASMRSGRATLTGPISLVQASGTGKIGFLLLMPIYRPDAPLTTPEQREEANYGWSFAPLMIDEVMNGFRFGEGGADFTLSLRDHDDTVAGRLFYTSSGAARPAAAHAARHIAIPIHGRVWDAEYRASESFIASLNLRAPQAVILSGFGVSMLLAALVFLLAHNRRRAAQLRDEMDRRAAIVDASSDAIVGVSMQGLITSWNRAAEHVFGYAQDDALGQPLGMLDLAEGAHTGDADVLSVVLAGQARKPFDAVRRRRDGSPVEVSISASPIRDLHGRVVAAALTIHDVSEQHAAHSRLRELSAALEDKVVERTAGLEAARHDLQRTLEALRHSEAFLDRTGRVAGVGGWEVDVETSEIKWSAQVYRIHEVDPSVVPRLDRALSFYTPESRPIIERAVAEAMAHGTGWDLEVPFVTATGRRIWVRTVGETQRRDGRVVRLLGAFQDVTDRRLALEKLSRAGERFALASDAAGIGVWERDLVGGGLHWDEWMHRLFGFDPAERIDAQAAWAHGVHEGDRERVQREMAASITERRDFDSEFRVVWPGGEVRHLKAAARVLDDDAGNSLRMIGVNIDITDRKRAELELERAASLLRIVLESATEVAIVAVDTQGRINLFNSGAERLLGYERDEVIGTLQSTAFHDRAEMHERAAALSRETGRVVRTGLVMIDPAALGRPQAWSYIRKDGRRVPVSLSVTAMVNPGGECFGYLGVAHDVTRQVQYEASLKEAVRLAEQANLAKSQFLANMSHEIRTPMNAVMGLSYLLGHTELDDEQSDLLDKVKLASKSLLGVIDDILDISKIEAGELKVESAPFSLTALLDDLGGVMRVHADGKSIGFDVETPVGLPAALVGDALRVNQILTNLLSNAIKFTLQGGVRLVVHALEHGDDRVLLRFDVRDTGIGIAPESAARLFQPFSQADTSTTRRFGGTGLGLSIVRQLAEMMGGRVGLESVPNEGSCFWVELPFAVADAAALAPAARIKRRSAARGLGGVRVLVVDDSTVNLEVARRILELEGATVALAENGQVAVDRLRAGPADFDVVLMDVQMPVLDGHAATRAIRGELGLTTLPVIALTAGALTSQHREAMEAGMDGFIGKPFHPHHVVETISALLRPDEVSTLGDALTAPDLPAPPPAMPIRASERADASTASNAPGWPVLPGVDIALARRRFGDDPTFFRSLMSHLIEEFTELRLHAGIEAEFGRAAAWLHKLKGSAGNVGATVLHAAAAAAESAARQRNRALLERGLDVVNAQLGVLGEGMRGSVPVAHAVADGPAAPLASGALDELLELFRRQDVSAIDRTHEIAPALRQRLGADRCATLIGHADNLRFSEACEVLERG